MYKLILRLDFNLFLCNKNVKKMIKYFNAKQKISNIKITKAMSYNKYDAQSPRNIFNSSPMHDINAKSSIKEKDVEQVFSDPGIKNEPYRDKPITTCVDLDHDKISGLSYFVCILSLLDHFSFALTFSLTQKLTTQEPYKWAYDIQLFA